MIFSCVDQPTVISGETIAYLEPQETVWRGQSGRKFTLAKTNAEMKLDALASFENVCGFQRGLLSYPGTLFRFPLRTTPTELSSNTYTVQKLCVLLSALRKEAKFLLLFLRSVHTIEVIDIAANGRQTLSFKVSIDEQAGVCQERSTFLHKLKSQHQREQYGISTVISYTADFHVSIADNNYDENQTGQSHWLVANQVGSTDRTVCQAAMQQCVFPWVGTALELQDAAWTKVSPGGRIFCVIPMPGMASSGLPIHVNGTFGVNDDRRTLKWPDRERRNDLTANWNVTLATELLPLCYLSLLSKAKAKLAANRFYAAWPTISDVPQQWKGLLAPLFTALFNKEVFWAEAVGEWINPDQGVLIPSSAVLLADIVQTTLSNCGVKLVNLPPHIWAALAHIGRGVTEVSPRLARQHFRKQPSAYSKTKEANKKALLKYCLSDQQYNDLQGIFLLPTANGSFVVFQTRHSYYSSPVYLCSSDCPRYLLPNMDASLVEVTGDLELQMSLGEVADQSQTQLYRLTVENVVALLSQAMPEEWQRLQVVSMPHATFPKTWFRTFWQWANRRSTLSAFHNSLTLPVLQTGGVKTSCQFRVARLNHTQALLLVPSYTYLDPSLLTALDKLQVMCCTQTDFPYVIHRDAIAYLKSFNPDGLLNAIELAFTNVSAIARLTFQTREAECLRELLSKNPYTSDRNKQAVLSNLAIYSTTSGTLCSVSHAKSSSVVRTAMRKPLNSIVSLQHLPSNFILFSNQNQSQNTLLQRCGGVEVPSDVELLLNHIFPLITKGQIASNDLMAEVLTMFQALKFRDCSNRFTSALRELPFLNGWQKKRPRELFDPQHEVSKLFQGEAKFPIAPFDSRSHLQVLRLCGLRTSVTAQELVNIIVEIAAAGQQRVSTSAVKIARAKAVLKYIENNMLNQLDTYCNIPGQGSRLYSFSQALKYLAQYFSWLPIAQRPQDYPPCLQWKGAGYESCFTSLDSATLALAATDQKNLPYIVGSQVFVLDPPLDSILVKVFPSNLHLAFHVVDHFKQVLHHQGEMHPTLLERVVNFTYQFLSKASAVDLSSLPPWVWIKRDGKFVRPSEIALKQDSNFRHNLEPYIYILPDNLLLHSALFERFGAKEFLSRAQIVSVLEKIAKSGSSRTSDWNTVMSILNWLTKDGTQECHLDSIFVPVDSSNETLKLVCAKEVVYTDNDFLKQHTESADESYTFVHKRINSNLARCLGIESLDKFLDITEDTFEDSGQHEPLTTRLRNILRDYKDGLTIIKELLQNADDAGATEVNICYDARTHTVPENSLFFRGMSACHGPALIVHNNAVFEDDDFKNIEMLAGATKEGKALKIGKFGVGFCSVYHITDVPSFISQDKLVIFDPTTSFLLNSKEAKNPPPGKRIAFMSKFIARSSQLEPYKNLFGFSPQQPYNGTLFRLPFRTRSSELSSTIYSPATVNEMTGNIETASSKLLLFLQKVKRITFQQFDPGCEEPRFILDIRKEVVPFPLQLSSTVIQKFSCTVSDSHLTSQYFVIASDTQTIDGKLATASVACEVQEAQPGSTAFKVGCTVGETFCFLPLSQETGLPVHVSANFAVINNRRGIWTSASDKSVSVCNPEVSWNESLMRCVIPKVYYQLLTSLQHMCANGKLQDYSSSFPSLWPTTNSLEQRNPWERLVTSLYQFISTGRLFYSHSTGQWLTLRESKFLKPGILCHGEGVLPCVRNTVNQLRMPIVDLPVTYQAHLSINRQTIAEEAFIRLFFEKLSSSVFNQEDRNAVICHMLETYAAEYDDGTSRCYSLDDCVKAYACIPCSPDGSVLKLPTEVVAMDAKFSKLYDPEEHMFPVKELTSRHLVCDALQALGIVWETIPWEMVIERAETVAGLFKINKEKALQRTSLILDCIEKYTDHSKNPDTEKQKIQLIAVNFLPVLQKPSKYNLPWCGDNYQLLCANQLMITGGFMSRDNACLAGSQVAFMCEDAPKKGGCGYIHNKTREFLSIRTSPSPMEVIEHFKNLITFSEGNEITETLVKTVEATCSQVYGFLNDQLQDEESPDTREWLQELRSIPCLWSGRQFIRVEMVAKHWKSNGPYLYHTPDIVSIRKQLSSALQIKDEFTLEDFQQALQKMKDTFGSNPIDNACEVLFREVQGELHAIFSKKTAEDSEQSHPVCIALPDQALVLHWSTDLAYNDAAWLPQDEEYIYVHKYIPWELAQQLGVKAVRSRVLSKYASKHGFAGIEFGQHEELTGRIQNILRDYPFNITVLKELLQNADDAKATKMCVILDKRTHGADSVLSEEWKKLQGPALLVWNDSTFTESDLKGIQNLGLGSKRSDAETIGQYGIGFNVVYHLTDCPSFVTGGETMCIFDPHCRYVHGSDNQLPGRRFDNLKEGFWKKFPDMQSTYLQAGLDNCPKELLSGSLFRFPLRHTRELVNKSKVIDSSVVLDCENMHRKVTTWAPEMKQAMFFLNHVKELRFYVIKEGGKMMITEHHFQSHVDKSARQSCNDLRTKLSAFKKEKGSEACVIRYRLTLTELNHNDSSREKKEEEQWVIQQGVGDIQNTERRWAYVKRVKPRHGIAAPLHHRESHDHKVFCFLPLPIRSKLPVHINGHFILNSTRSGLWNSDPDYDDDRSKWNKYLCEAIASSYEDFLINSQQFYLSQRPYNAYDKANSAVYQYYKLFPDLRSGKSSKSTAKTDKPSASSRMARTYRTAGLSASSAPAEPPSKTPEGHWWEIARSVYLKLHGHNAKVLAIIGKSFTVEVHPLKNEDNPSKQVYFWSARLDHHDDDNAVKPILKKIGMLITQAPWNVYKSFSKVEVELPLVEPKTVFGYYTSFSSQASPIGFPCPIEATKFGSAEFKKLTKYVLKHSEKSSPLVPVMEYPELPFSHPLLLTADGQLRCFDEANKVLHSYSSHLFPASRDKFLHPSLLDVHYTPEYFVRCAQDLLTGTKCISKDYQTHQDLLHGILTKNQLLQALCADSVNSADRYIPQLKALWHCLTFDRTFNAHLGFILKTWAVLLSTDKRLFSMSSKIHPVYMPTKNDVSTDPTFGAVYKLLVKLKMPFLNTAVVTAEVECPKLSCDYTRVLAILYHMNRKAPITVNEEIVCTLVSYFQRINFKNATDRRICKAYITSLPLFKSIDGSYTSVHGKRAYMWTDKASCIGLSKWLLPGDNVVFVNPMEAWKDLATAEVLGIETIAAEEIYVQFIFPRFSSMNTKERYRHLEHIRDRLFSVNNLRSNDKNEDQTVRITAVRFIEALKDLPCLGEQAPLLRVRDFASHNVEILTTFKHHHTFLSEYFTDNEKQCEKWMKFFLEIGLKQSISQDEYTDYCHEISKGQHDDPGKASYVLLEHLFPKETREDGWIKDAMFLNKVSNIPFVCSRPLKNLHWIKPVATPSNTVVHRGNTIHMTQLNGAGDYGKRLLLWTITPVVSLPCGLYPSPEEVSAMEHLHIVMKPSKEDVMQNITNICKSRFADFMLFDKYSTDCEAHKHATKVIEVLCANFKFLWGKYQESLTDMDLKTLADLPCIPVHSTADHLLSVAVLVRPCCVLTSESSFHPFLNQLPHELLSVSGMLSRIGVNSTLQLSNVQVALQTAFESSESQELSPGTQTCVARLLSSLYRLLMAKNDEEKLQALSPLYLTDTEHRLVSTNYLMYTSVGDNIDLLDLDGTGMSIFRLWPEEKFHVYYREFSEYDFCELIPEQLRPKHIRKCCNWNVSTECERVEGCILAEHFANIVTLPTFLRAVVKVCSEGDKSTETEEALSKVLQNIKFVTVDNLLLEISLKDTGKCIGQLHRGCYYEPQTFTLYMNPNLSNVTEVHAYAELADAIISQSGVNAANTNIKEVIMLILRADEPSQIITALAYHDITLESRKDDFDLRRRPTLGRAIPQYWHHRLDQDIDNVFHSMEWVGYQRADNVVIFAKISHLVMAEDGNIPSLYVRRYKVYTSEEEEEGIEVSVLDLYKFLRGLKKLKDGTMDPATSEIVPYEGESDVNRFREVLESTDIKDIKIKLCEDLKDIWKLPERERSKAIRRLYLKWHPDKNLDNSQIAEEIFKFLKIQMARLEQGKEPMLETSDEPAGFHHSWTWERQYGEWDQTAHEQKSSHQNESTSGSTSGASPFDSPRPSKKPQVGNNWFRQAEVEYRGLAVLEKADATLSCLVCFLAHQVAEKALKGGMFAECGEATVHYHNLTPLAYALQNEQPGFTQGLATHTIPLESYYLEARYPNRWPGHATPANKYTPEEAQEAQKHAAAILETVRVLPNMP